MSGVGLPSPGARRLRLWALCVLALVVLGWAVWLPSAYPSSSLLYKFGADRFMLIGGKMAGAALLFIMAAQLVLVARPAFLERAAGLDRLVAWHRFVGAAVVVLAVVHPLLVFAPEDVAAMPLQWEYWPEVLGVGLLISLALSGVLSWWRRYAKLPYHLWKAAHFLGAPALLTGSLVHVYFVTDSFHSGQPLWFLIFVGVVSLVSWGWVAAKKLLGGGVHVVDRVVTAGPSAREIHLKPEGAPILHEPGQFAVLHPMQRPLGGEAHPFTIASGAGEDALRFVIRCSGDWTAQVGALKPGDRIRVDGPLGLFSPAAFDKAPVVCIAGGVGATPMLSMIRSMTSDSPPLHFIWANRTTDDVFNADELTALQEELPQLRVSHVFTREREPDAPAMVGRLGKSVLKELLGNSVVKDQRYFVCGPPEMMATVARHLRELGADPSRIVMEEFGF